MFVASNWKRFCLGSWFWNVTESHFLCKLYTSSHPLTHSCAPNGTISYFTSPTLPESRPISSAVTALTRNISSRDPHLTRLLNGLTCRILSRDLHFTRLLNTILIPQSSPQNPSTHRQLSRSSQKSPINGTPAGKLQQNTTPYYMHQLVAPTPVKSRITSGICGFWG